jgi:hypothetical protein
MTPEETDKLVRSTAKLMGTLLIARRDVKAIETSGGWIPDREQCDKHDASRRCANCNDAPSRPFKISDFHQHLLGQRCMGTYLLDENDRVKFFALDFDLQKEGAEWWLVHEPDDPDAWTGSDPMGEVDLDATQTGNLEAALHDPLHSGHRWARILIYDTLVAFRQIINDQLGLPVLPVVTGGGAHLLVPFGNAIPAREARDIAKVVMDASGWKNVKGDGVFWRAASPSLEIEVFPKQDALSKSGASFGNLIRLPLGWHRGAQVRTYFLDMDKKGAKAWDLPKAGSLATMQAAAAALGVEA